MVSIVVELILAVVFYPKMSPLKMLIMEVIIVFMKDYLAFHWIVLESRFISNVQKRMLLNRKTKMMIRKMVRLLLLMLKIRMKKRTRPKRKVKKKRLLRRKMMRKVRRMRILRILKMLSKLMHNKMMRLKRMTQMM